MKNSIKLEKIIKRMKAYDRIFFFYKNKTIASRWIIAYHLGGVNREARVKLSNLQHLRV